MFDLEQAIADWRRQMLAAGIQSPVPLEELELHLREELERQTKTGLNEREAFEIAVLQIGGAGALTGEFKKAGDAKERRERMIFRVVLCAAIVWLGGILLMGFHAFLKYDMSLAWRLAGFADMAAITLSVLGWRGLNRAFPVIPDKRVRTTIGVAFGLFGMAGMIVFMKFILPNISFTEGQLTVVVLWALTLMAAFGVVLAGLEEASRKQTGTADS